LATYRQTSAKSVIRDYSTSVNDIPHFCGDRVVISQHTGFIFFKSTCERLPICSNRLTSIRTTPLILYYCPNNENTSSFTNFTSKQ